MISWADVRTINDTRKNLCNRSGHGIVTLLYTYPEQGSHSLIELQPIQFYVFYRNDVG